MQDGNESSGLSAAIGSGLNGSSGTSEDRSGEEIAKKMIMEKMLYDIISSPEKLEKLRTFLSETYKN